MADPTCDLVVAALLMAAEHQGRQLGELLGALAAAAREEAAMRLRVEAERARIRSDLQIIVVTVVGFITVLLLADRAYYSPYDSPLGQLVLAGIAGIFAGAFALLLRLASGAASHRLLAVGSEDSAMSLAMVLGAGIGAGVVTIVRGLWPPRPSLAEALAGPHGARDPGTVPPAASGPGALARLGLPLVRALGSRHVTAGWSGGDLDVVGGQRRRISPRS